MVMTNHLPSIFFSVFCFLNSFKLHLSRWFWQIICWDRCSSSMKNNFMEIIERTNRGKWKIKVNINKNKKAWWMTTGLCLLSSKKREKLFNLITKLYHFMMYVLFGQNHDFFFCSQIMPTSRQVLSSTCVIVAPCPGEKIDLSTVFLSLPRLVSSGAAGFCQHSDARVSSSPVPSSCLCPLHRTLTSLVTCYG